MSTQQSGTKTVQDPKNVLIELDRGANNAKNRFYEYVDPERCREPIREYLRKILEMSREGDEVKLKTLLHAFVSYPQYLDPKKQTDLKLARDITSLVVTHYLSHKENFLAPSYLKDSRGKELIQGIASQIEVMGNFGNYQQAHEPGNRRFQTIAAEIQEWFKCEEEKTRRPSDYYESNSRAERMMGIIKDSKEDGGKKLHELYSEPEKIEDGLVLWKKAQAEKALIIRYYNYFGQGRAEHERPSWEKAGGGEEYCAKCLHAALETMGTEHAKGLTGEMISQLPLHELDYYTKLLSRFYGENDKQTETMQSLKREKILKGMYEVEGETPLLRMLNERSIEPPRKSSFQYEGSRFLTELQYMHSQGDVISPGMLLRAVELTSDSDYSRLKGALKDKQPLVAAIVNEQIQKKDPASIKKDFSTLKEYELPALIELLKKCSPEHGDYSRSIEVLTELEREKNEEIERIWFGEPKEKSKKEPSDKSKAGGEKAKAQLQPGM